MNDSESHDPSSRNRKASISQLKRIIKGVIAVLVVVGLYFATKASFEQWREQRSQIESQLREIENELRTTSAPLREEALRQEQQRLQRSLPTIQNLNWRYIGFAAIIYAMGLVPNGILLHSALYALGQRPRLSTTVAAHLLGHVGKCVPGKAMVVVLRAGALAKEGVSALPATICIFLETFLMMAVGGALAAAIVVWLPVPQWISLMAIGIAVCASLPTLPPIMRFAAAKVSKSRDVSQDSRIGFRLFAIGWMWSAVAWALIGASFALLILAIPSADPLPSLSLVYGVATAAISLAIVVGFASLLPGGAGIRELVLTTILSVSIGTAQGLLAAIAARILFLVTEVVLAAFCWLWLKRKNPS
ncbi:MAG: lysylphosphatidylglycerol synthase transmembrane domain-containing protein [Planctomycetota bacterium]